MINGYRRELISNAVLNLWRVEALVPLASSLIVKFVFLLKIIEENQPTGGKASLIGVVAFRNRVGRIKFKINAVVTDIMITSFLRIKRKMKFKQNSNLSFVL